MNKTILYSFYCFLFVCFVSFGQNKQQITIDWTEGLYQLSGTAPIKLPLPANHVYQFNSADQSMEVTMPILSNVILSTDDVVLSNIKTKRIQAYQYPELNIKNIPTNIQYEITAGKVDNQAKNVLTINPFIKKGNDIHKVLSFDYQVFEKSKRQVSSSGLQLTQSVLATGDWFKIKVNKSGIYKLDRNFLMELGLPSGVDPKTIKIYGYGGKMLPFANDENHYFDPPELAIYAHGENDGVLNDEDYFYFYAEGTEAWNPELGTHLNLFSDNAYYYVTYGGTAGKRVSNFVNTPSNSVAATITYANTRVFHEVDLKNIAHVSSRWVGEDFSSSYTQTFPFSLPNIVPNSKAIVSGVVVANSTSPSYMDIRLNGQQLENLPISEKVDAFYKAVEKFFKYEVSNQAESSTIQINFNNNGVPSARGYIDYLAIDYEQKLQGYGKQFSFHNNQVDTISGKVKYVLSNTNNISQIWNVTDTKNPKILSNNQANSLSIFADATQNQNFIAFDPADAYQPEIAGILANQNLKGTIFSDGPVDYLLITRSEFLEQANRLANLHEEKSQLNVKVVDVQSIYNEFSNGQQDISAIRNFVRYVYHNGPNNRKLRYLNLLGEASFDLKDRVESNTNIIPTFHSVSSTQVNGKEIQSNYNLQLAFVTDDFFVLLDEGEGVISNQNYTGLDVAVGRMLALDVAEAKVLVDKVVSYYEKENIGAWKISGIALADDVDSSLDSLFEITLEEGMEQLLEEKPFFNIQKIYMDAYKQEITAGGARYPQAKIAFLNSLNRGALFVNYLGHGGYNGLASERILDIVDIENLTNVNRLPLFIIVTCEFTKYDDPTFLSGGEQLLKKEFGGGVSLLATSRKVGLNSAKRYTERINQYLFNLQNTTSADISVAEVLRKVKNTNIPEKGVIGYLGDPALKLSIPKIDVVLTKINNTEIGNYSGHIRALDKVKIEGQIQTSQGQFLSDFNGKVAIQVFDKFISKRTLANDNTVVGNSRFRMNFNTLGEVIFRGNATVKNGVFSLEFMMPKDIQQEIGKGKFSFYAQKDSQILEDYTGANLEISIGGINPDAAEDNIPPKVELYMNDETFINGGNTTPSPLFIAKIEDENGINTASGIGHDIVAILDENTSNPVILNDFFETEPDNYQKGFVKYPFKNLEKGLHTITFKVWDSYNNMTQKQIEFYVDERDGVVLENVLNYPNPFINSTQFWFSHNKPGQTLKVQVQIFTVAGRIIKTINRTIVAANTNVREITWDGKDDFGNKIAKGVYIYKLKVLDMNTGESTEKIEKIVKL